MDKNQSFAKNLFLGKITEENLFPYPSFTPEEQELLGMLIESIDKFLSGKEAMFKEFDEKAHQSPEFINNLKELGLFGLIIPEEYSGVGLGSKAYSRTIQQLGRYDASTALTVGAHCSIGMRGLLLFGNPEQKDKYFSKLATGEMVAAFCLTESGAGSDAASVKTTATKQEDGSWILNGEKIWITNGPFADFFTVFAKTESGEAGKMSAFLVEKAYQGVSSGPKEDKMGIRGSATSTITFSNVKIPAANLLGEEGKGFKIAMHILNSGRTGLGGGCIGAMKNCIKLATEQSSNRKQFGKKISDFMLIKEKIALMTVDCFVTESLVNFVAHLSDSGVNDYSMEAAASKIFATEAMWRVIDEALQIAGGNGFMKEYPYERIVRDSRINRIFEGTNEILRLYIALTGFDTVGQKLKNVSNVFDDPIKGFGILKDYAADKVAQVTGVGVNELNVVPELVEFAEIYTDYALALARSSEALVKEYRKDIIGKQMMSKRVANVTIDLLAGLTTLSRVNSMIKVKGAEDCHQEIMIVDLFTQAAKRRMNQSLRRLEKNEDLEIQLLADSILENGGYKWDLL